MESLSRALEIIFGVMIFVIAMTILFSMVSQAKQTSDIVFEMQDDSKYLSDELEGITYFLSNNSVSDSLITREVGWETVIPTVYRYFQEQYGVTIVDTSGNIIARYDTNTESVAGIWYENKKPLTDGSENPNKVNNTNEFEYLTKKVYAENDHISRITSEDNLEEIFESIYEISGASGGSSIKFGSPWLRRFKQNKTKTRC